MIVRLEKLGFCDIKFVRLEKRKNAWRRRKQQKRRWREKKSWRSTNAFLLVFFSKSTVFEFLRLCDRSKSNRRPSLLKFDLWVGNFLNRQGVSYLKKEHKVGSSNLKPSQKKTSLKSSTAFLAFKPQGEKKQQLMVPSSGWPQQPNGGRKIVWENKK